MHFSHRKKNEVLEFFTSFIPGATEMYMGFMKSGFSLMLVFFTVLIIPTLISLPTLFMIFALLVWFFSFFHARNLISCPDEEFDKQEDKFIWEELFPTLTLNKHVLTWSGAFFILVGLDAILNSAGEGGYFGDYYNDTATNILGAIMVIILGVYLIRQAKKHVEK